MDLDLRIACLSSNAQTIRVMLQHVSTTQAQWKPHADSWSILEVINHLCDEEVDDFRRRLDTMLHSPGQPLTEIDPVGWAGQRRYNERDLSESVDRFRVEREASLRLLRALESPNWDLEHVMPWGGTMRAGDMLASWVAHDLLHIRQLVRLVWAVTTRELLPYKIEYAGRWR